ncbi:MAG: hypothetical protein ACM3NQ_16940, partial [Bacteroidales bacterium]
MRAGDARLDQPLLAGFLRASSSMRDQLGWLARFATRVLDVRSEEEREKRAAHLVALLLVAAAATVKPVAGLTLHDSPFTLYTLAIAASAAHGGFAPALVATLASLLLGG